MKDWKKLIPDTQLWMNKHYTEGRAGKRPKIVVIHHNAGVLSAKQIYRVWQTRPASAHYQVESSGRIVQLVRRADTAWHAGAWNINLESIGIEISNSGGAADGWPIDPRARKEAAKLVAAICLFYKLGVPKAGTNVRFHREFCATACPGQLAPGGKYFESFMRDAAKFYKEFTTPSQVPKHLKPDYSRLALEQLVGAGRKDGRPDFTGWKQLGGHTLVDAVAIIGQTLGIPGFGVDK
ncbi:MAG: peptidoglycan recognition family protein [Lawsonella sp.]